MEREEDKGKNKRRINRVQHSRKVTELYKNGDNRKKNSKNKDPREVGVSTMLTTIDCGNEVMLKQIEQHGEEAEGCHHTYGLFWCRIELIKNN